MPLLFFKVEKDSTFYLQRKMYDTGTYRGRCMIMQNRSNTSERKRLSYMLFTLFRDSYRIGVYPVDLYFAVHNLSRARMLCIRLRSYRFTSSQPRGDLCKNRIFKTRFFKLKMFPTRSNINTAIKMHLLIHKEFFKKIRKL